MSHKKNSESGAGCSDGTDSGIRIVQKYRDAPGLRGSALRSQVPYETENLANQPREEKENNYVFKQN